MTTYVTVDPLSKRITQHPRARSLAELPRQSYAVAGLLSTDRSTVYTAGGAFWTVGHADEATFRLGRQRF